MSIRVKITCILVLLLFIILVCIYLFTVTVTHVDIVSGRIRTHQVLMGMEFGRQVTDSWITQAVAEEFPASTPQWRTVNCDAFFYTRATYNYSNALDAMNILQAGLVSYYASPMVRRQMALNLLLLWQHDGQTGDWALHYAERVFEPKGLSGNEALKLAAETPARNVVPKEDGLFEYAAYYPDGALMDRFLGRPSTGGRIERVQVLSIYE